MANEAVLVKEMSPAVPMTCADGTGIEKGAILKLGDDLTASINSGNYDVVAGIAQSEKIAGNGTNAVSVYQNGWFRIKGSGTGSTGDPVATIATYTNYVQSVVNVAGISGRKILGYALQDWTNGQDVLIELKPSGGNGV